MSSHTMSNRVAVIMKYLVASLDNPYHGSSSMTTSIYDTAWLAMVSKPILVGQNEEIAERQWVFPQSFQAILDSQGPDGGFTSHEGATQVDAILNCMSALLALCKHVKFPSITGCTQVDYLPQRIARAQEFLRKALGCWDILSTDHVGYEILVPKLLELLKTEGEMDFHGVIPNYETLMEMRSHKIARLSHDVFYSSHRTTLIHSLEAFIGELDFDKLSHHISMGAMMNSPSSTAAYLMGCSTWDDEAEAYLHYVAANGKGLVPSAFPISLFEISWALSAFLEAGITVQELGRPAVERLVAFVETHLKDGKGICGFAPCILPDADDSAKCILFLNLVGQQMDCDKMISVFESQTHFKTYTNETTRSFSANCNVVKAILSSGKASHYTPQICKALDYLFRTWGNGQLKDKWNLSPLYSIMLLTEVLLTTLRLWDLNDLIDLPRDLMETKAPIISFQITLRTMSLQLEDGSWAKSPEITAYAILTLKKMVTLPWNKDLRILINRSIRDGINYLQKNEDRWDVPDLIWVEKVSYGSKILSQAYCLAAIVTSSSYEWNGNVLRVFSAFTLGENPESIPTQASGLLTVVV